MLADSSIALCSVGFHYDDFVWAVSSVMSRVNKVPIIDTNEYTLSLVPYWDMANHTTGTVSAIFLFCLSNVKLNITCVI